MGLQSNRPFHGLLGGAADGFAAPRPVFRVSRGRGLHAESIRGARRVIPPARFHPELTACRGSR